MVLFSLSDISLEFADKTVLDSVSFSLNEGDRLGIIGVNGAGKSSLVKILTGEYEPTRGSVSISSDKRIGVLNQNVIITDEDKGMTVLEYMHRAFDSLISLEREIEAVQRRLDDAVSEGNEAKITAMSQLLAAKNHQFISDGGLEFSGRCRSTLLSLGFTESQLTQSVASLSGGQHTRLSLCRLLVREPDLLILDEPTNHLDIDALMWLEDFICSYKKTVIIISHDRYFLDKTTTKTLHLRYGKARLYVGNYSKCKAQEELDAASLEKKYKEQQKVIARIKANIDFQRSCSMEHNFVTIRAKEKQLARMEKVELAPKAEKNIRISFNEETESAGEVLSVKNLSFSYTDDPLLDNLSFLVRRGERVFFLGENGCGKSTLIKILMGKLQQRGGRFEFGYNIKIGYFDQENSSLNLNNTIFEEMREEYPTKTDYELRSALALFLFGEDEVEKKLSSLSGGERARVTLAKLMLKKVNLLIMDEPTNHLDIGSREALEVSLQAFSGTIIAVSHDRYFINALATRIIELSRGSLSDFDLEMAEDAYTEYMRLREAKRMKNASANNTDKTPSEGKASYLAQKEAERQKRMEENKKKRAAAEIEKLEAEETTLREELYGKAAEDYIRAAQIDTRLQEIEARLLELYEIVM